MTEQTYTLEQAERELKRRDCEAGRHRPDIEDADFSGRLPTWYCKCGAVTWEGVRR